tara:strand:+ start:3105 stop:4157 length:1053 start_codon:yes stop_codon:yes gene_type:complete
MSSTIPDSTPISSDTDVYTQLKNALGINGSGNNNTDDINVDPTVPDQINVLTDPLYLSMFLVVLLLVITLMVYLGGFGKKKESEFGSLSLGEYEPGSGSTSSGFGSGLGPTGKLVSKIILITLLVALLMYIVQYMLFYYFNIDVIASFKNLLPNVGTPQKQKPEVKVTINQSQPKPKPKPKLKPLINIEKPAVVDKREVFNIPDNVYTYENAKNLCKAYDASLATYDQVEEAYRKGGEWCNYGWSANQLALFPTSKKTYAELQKTDDHKNDCGRPGINGGFIGNDKVRFGVNCYGIKPKMTPEEEKQMNANNTPYPKNKKDIALEKKVQYWKNKTSEIMVSPFNYTTWNG